MSKQDTHFFNTFSLVIGLLVAVAILLFVFSRVVAGRTQEPETYADPLYRNSVEERIKPLTRVAVAGRDNSALVMKGPASGTAIVLEVPKDGPALFEAVCKTCHGAGLAGAPVVGNRAAWAPRIATGIETLHMHSIKGYTGKTGVMPSKGGRTDLPDELVEAAVDYMVAQSR